MARRCGCSGADCSCAVVAGDCTTVTGNGSQALPYTVSTRVSGDAGNRLECRDDGLYGVGADVAVVDSATVDHTLTGDGSAGAPYTLTSDVVLTPDGDVPDGGNLIEFGPTGIYVSCEDVSDCFPGAGGSIIQADNTDESCVDVTVSGAGTAGDPVLIAAAPVLDPDPCNTLTCGPDGLFVPPVERVTAAGREVMGFNPNEDVALAGGAVCFDYRISVTNPSTCCPVSFSLQQEFYVVFRALVDADVRLGSGAVGNPTQTLHRAFVNGAGQTQDWRVTARSDGFAPFQNLAPGATVDFDRTLCLSSPAGVNPGELFVDRLIVEWGALGIGQCQ